MTLFITLGDIFGIVVGVLVFACLGFFYAREAWRQKCCLHDGGVSETQACEAICRKCGKNLGFIGSIRKGETP